MLNKRHGIHVSLMWEGFAKFIASYKSKNDVMLSQYLEHARNLREIMSLKYQGRDGEQNLCDRLQHELKFLANLASVQLGQYSTDLSLEIIIGNRRKIAVNFKIKVDLGKGGNDAVLQNILYYVHANRNDEDEGLDPMLLISIVGCHYFQVFGVVFGPDNEVLMDPLCDPISLLHVPHDPLGSETALLQIIKQTVVQLQSYYTKPSTIRVPYYKQESIR